jgi:transcriptional regulator with XRE-family HTH domain
MRRLRAERVCRGWRLLEVAARTGIDLSQLSRFERGRAEPSGRQRQALEELFGLPWEELAREVELTVKA